MSFSSASEYSITLLSQGEIWTKLKKSLEAQTIHDEILEECHEGDFDNVGFMGHIDTALYHATNTSTCSGLICQDQYGAFIFPTQSTAYFRGEPRVFEQSTSSLQRLLLQENNEEQKNVCKAINFMRFYEFKTLLDRFEVVSGYTDYLGKVFYEAIAEHYGFVTEWLSFTDDFATALFCATCKFDEQTQQWRPLNAKEVDEYRYGVIFEQADIQKQMPLCLGKIDSPDFIRPVGYQPFFRSELIHSFVCRTSVPLQQNTAFKSIRFRQSVDFSKTVYDYLKKGSSVFPYKALRPLLPEINEIKNTLTFSQKAFDEMLKLGLFANPKSFEEAVQQSSFKKVEIVTKPAYHDIEDEKIEDIDDDYEEFDNEFIDFRYNFYNLVAFPNVYR